MPPALRHWRRAARRALAEPRIAGIVRHGPIMHLATLVTTSNQIAITSSRLKKIERLAELLRDLAPDEIAIAIGFLTGWPRQGKIGIGWATLDAARPPNAAREPTLTLAE